MLLCCRFRAASQGAQVPPMSRLEKGSNFRNGSNFLGELEPFMANTHTHTLIHTHSHTPTLSLTHTLLHTLSLSHTHTRTHSHTLTFTPTPRFRATWQRAQVAPMAPTPRKKRGEEETTGKTFPSLGPS